MSIPAVGALHILKLNTVPHSSSFSFCDSDNTGIISEFGIVSTGLEHFSSERKLCDVLLEFCAAFDRSVVLRGCLWCVEPGSERWQSGDNASIHSLATSGLLASNVKVLPTGLSLTTKKCDGFDGDWVTWQCFSFRKKEDWCGWRRVRLMMAYFSHIFWWILTMTGQRVWCGAPLPAREATSEPGQCDLWPWSEVMNIRWPDLTSKLFLHDALECCCWLTGVSCRTASDEGVFETRKCPSWNVGSFSNGDDDWIPLMTSHKSISSRGLFSVHTSADTCLNITGLSVLVSWSRIFLTCGKSLLLSHTFTWFCLSSLLSSKSISPSCSSSIT